MLFYPRAAFVYHLPEFHIFHIAEGIMDLERQLDRKRNREEMASW